VNASINGGNILKEAVLGGITGAVFGGIGIAPIGDSARTLAHGVAGGTLSKLRGGSFGEGFLSASFAKFANGAQTAAFAHLFNAELSTSRFSARTLAQMTALQSQPPRDPWRNYRDPMVGFPGGSGEVYTGKDLMVDVGRLSGVLLYGTLHQLNTVVSIFTAPAASIDYFSVGEAMQNASEGTPLHYRNPVLRSLGPAGAGLQILGWLNIPVQGARAGSYRTYRRLYDNIGNGAN